MATITSDRISYAAGRKRDSSAFASVKSFWRDCFARTFHPDRPELHYMRGPGPAWRAKYGDAAAFRLKSGDV